MLPIMNVDVVRYSVFLDVPLNINIRCYLRDKYTLEITKIQHRKSSHLVSGRSKSFGHIKMQIWRQCAENRTNVAKSSRLILRKRIVIIS